MQESLSEKLFMQAKKYIPGGVNSPVRAYSQVDRVPRFIKQAQGSHITDVDGNCYIDYVCSWGPGILGHAHPAVIAQVTDACQNGLTFGAPTENEVILAQLLSELVPSMELSRLVCSGTEAVMGAVRVARGYTGRDKIIKFKGCYHGHSDGLLVKAGSGAMTSAVPDSAGVPRGCINDTLVAGYNDIDSVADLFAAHQGQIAAIIVEPVAANMGVVLPKPGFLQKLRQLATQNGALLIFDEVITGFRLALGGAQQYYNVTPDLTVLGKIVGGGMPIGAYGGKREIMNMVSPAGPVYQAGTLAGNPVATAAGIATLRQLLQDPGIYTRLEEKTLQIQKAIQERFCDTVQVNRAGSLMSLFFTKQPVDNYESALTTDIGQFRRYFNFLLDHLIYIAPSNFEAMFISNAHTESDIETTVRVIQAFPYH